jgi:hypothetical protein
LWEEQLQPDSVHHTRELMDGSISSVTLDVPSSAMICHWQLSKSAIEARNSFNRPLDSGLNGLVYSGA